MFIPYRDDNPHVLIPYVTYGLIALNLLVFIYQHLLGGDLLGHAFALRYGLIPARFWGAHPATILDFNRELLSKVYHISAARVELDVDFLPVVATLFTSTFVHGGWFHILGNMLFLYVFADNVEGVLGHNNFVFFYILTGLAAGLLHLLVMPDSMLPVVGASGAISGIMGAYLVRFPRARIHVLVFIIIFITTIRLPAAVVLGLWFLIQASNGLMSLQMQLSGGGVAWFEHIGGFVAGFSYMVIKGGGIKFPSRYG